MQIKPVEQVQNFTLTLTREELRMIRMLAGRTGSNSNGYDTKFRKFVGDLSKYIMSLGIGENDALDNCVTGSLCINSELGQEFE